MLTFNEYNLNLKHFCILLHLLNLRIISYIESVRLFQNFFLLLFLQWMMVFISPCVESNIIKNPTDILLYDINPVWRRAKKKYNQIYEIISKCKKRKTYVYISLCLSLLLCLCLFLSLSLSPSYTLCLSF